MNRTELLEIAKPILFNTAMVQAILEGRKNTTRRPISGKTIEKGTNWFWNPNENVCFSPYKVGDILYVRETWKADSVDDRSNNMLIDFLAVQKGYAHAEVSVDFTEERYRKFRKFYQKPGWQPSQFMPKEAARLFRRVTDIRAERVQDITEEGAKAEGFKECDSYTELFHFANAWEGIYKNWEANPWVWVFGFERVEVQE